MAYNITSTSGLTSYTITNGAINNQTNLSFIGKGSLNYGSSLNTNFLRLLENFADVTEPDSPIIGQIWWDTSTNNLRVYDGVEFGIVTPPLDRITSSTIGNLEIASSSITGEITDGNINIGPNGTGNTVINRLAILNTGVGKVPYTAANGMIVTSTLSFNPTDNTLTATNLSATNIAGTLTTGPQAAITSVGTLDNLTVTGNATVGNLIASSASSSTLFTLTGSSTNGGVRANLISTGTTSAAVPLLIFSRTSTSTTVGNGGLGWFKTLTDGSSVQSSIYVNGTNTAGSPSTVMAFTSPNGFSFSGQSISTTIDTYGNVGIGTTTPTANLHVVSASDDPIIRLTNTSSAFSSTPNFVTGATGTGASELIFERTSNFSRSTNLVGGIYWKNTLTNSYVISSSITATSSNSGSGNFRLLYRAHHQHRFDTSSVNPDGSYDFTTAASQLSITPVGSAFLGNLTIGNGYALGGAPPTNYSALHVYGNIIGYFNGPIGTNSSANTGAFTTLTTTSTANVGNLVTTSGVYWANGNVFSAGASGGGTDKAFWENDTTITTSYAITAGKNAGTFGPVTINSGATVTIPSGSVWSIV